MKISFFLLCSLIFLPTYVGAQPNLDPVQPKDGNPAPNGPVSVTDQVSDDDIRTRIVEILEATGYYTRVDVSVKKGVVFLKGETTSEVRRTWAGDTASKVEGVVAVFNGLKADEPIVDFRPTINGLLSLGSQFLELVPLLLLSLVILFFCWIIAKWTTRLVQYLFWPHISNPLLRGVIHRTSSMVIFLVGLYLILSIAGLTRLAGTVIGGTGLVGLILGIAFRDITENFLSSLFLSFQQPFQAGDLIELAGTTGYVQRMTYRVTILMSLDGNHIQVPNATVFKSKIINYTSNPNRRVDFLIAISYTDSVAKAQDLALQILTEHPAVLKDPEPLILVEDFGNMSISLRIYFWVNGLTHSQGKVRSSVMRLIKQSFQGHGMIHPDMTSFLNIFGHPAEIPQTTPEKPRRATEEIVLPPEAPETVAEGGFSSEDSAINTQASHSRTPEPGTNLLEDQPVSK
ncbi:MAG: mechanosensitive ion channel family protein [Zavarzinella sp.]